GVVGLRRARVRVPAVFVVLAVAVWYCTWQSGVHATIAGVALAFVTPFEATRAGSTRPPADVLLERLHPWSSFVVVPLFALSNAGVALGAEATPGSARITLGIVVGLVVGKSVGVTLASWSAVRIRWAVLPDGVRWPQLAAAAMLAGIGFTMSLFITDLAFSGHEAALFADAAKRAILLASVVAALAGSAAFVVLARRRVEA
ncbi:MAG: Na+/H+ antiporter NhaA, partial [Actinobacteria bacterium]|nr:Na+/H+ antiporter NhaA [Actinomycetota bacterium]